MLDALHETRRVTHASIYLLAEDRPGFRLLDYRGPAARRPSSTPPPRAACCWRPPAGRRRCCWRTVERRIAELRPQAAEGKRSPRRAASALQRHARARCMQMKAGITVPLVGNDRVIGFLNLWDERVPEAFASDEIALILEIAERLATVVENCKLYERMRERDRLAALGEMAAGLAHEIRNPLGAIKGAAQCLDPKRLPGEDGEFLEVIVEEVNRLNGVVTAVPRLRPPAQAELRAHRPQRGGHPDPAADPERRAQARSSSRWSWRETAAAGRRATPSSSSRC